MTEANENFVNWIIKKVGINESSRLLEIGCGRGAYAINISKQTGCSFVGLDILPRFIEEGQELLKQHGVEDKGKILIGDMTKLSDVVGGQTFTHVLTLGCLFYIHDSMDAFLEQLKGFYTTCDATLENRGRNSGNNGLYHENIKFLSVASDPFGFSACPTYRSVVLFKLRGEAGSNTATAGYRLQYYNNDNNDFAKRSIETICSAGMKLVESGELPREALTFPILRGK
eukprot:sb/3469521/